MFPTSNLHQRRRTSCIRLFQHDTKKQVRHSKRNKTNANMLKVDRSRKLVRQGKKYQRSNFTVDQMRRFCKFMASYNTDYKYKDKNYVAQVIQ